MSTVRAAASDADLAAWTRVRNEVELAPSTTGSALHDAALGYARALGCEGSRTSVDGRMPSRWASRRAAANARAARRHDREVSVAVDLPAV